ncbi:hypothetical protein [Rhodopseudomonas sp. RCAM05734]|uniref:hypothetical protein n=1 Tax=Rhodopseudomonas sp. RCAM05734 TaxID=3457549 RepID=UPI0040441777
MNQIVTLPLVATQVSLGPVFAATGDDARLIELAGELQRLRGLCRQRSTEMSECDDAYRRPERPPVLMPRYDDEDVRPVPVSTTIDGRRVEWCREGDIDALRDRTEFHHWHFIGTPEQWDEFGLSSWRNNQRLPAGAPADLFLSLGDEYRLKRAMELIAALDAYREADVVARRESGFDAAERALQDVFKEESAVFEEMMELKPTTLEGFRAVASAVVNFCWLGEIEDGDTKDQQMVARMLSHLTGIEVS